MRPALPKTSIIIPTGGINRNNFLKLVIKYLRNTRWGKNWEYVLVEADTTSRIPESIKSKVDKYAFIKSDGMFNSGQVRNVGAKLSSGELLVFHDNDLLCTYTFLTDIVEGYNDHCCAGTTWHKVNYLSHNFSTKVSLGKRNVADAQKKDIIGTYNSGTVHGGSIWIRRQFFFDIKGYDESFDGWGCEDDAFWLKVKTLSKWKNGRELDLFHLYHEASGINIEGARSSNPEYFLHRQRLEKIYDYNKQTWLSHIKNVKEWGIN